VVPEEAGETDNGNAFKLPDDLFCFTSLENNFLKYMMLQRLLFFTQP